MDNLIRKIAAELHISADLLKKLIEIERPKVHLQKRRGAKDEIRRAIEDFLGRKEA